MKKLLAFIFCAVLIFSVAGCTINLGNGIEVNKSGVTRTSVRPTISGVVTQSGGENTQNSTGEKIQPSTGGNTQTSTGGNTQTSTGGNTQTSTGGSKKPGGEQPGGEQPGGEQPGGEQPGGEVSSDLKPLKYAGLSESAYVTWNESNVANAKAYYKLSSASSYTEVDGELIRETASGVARVDILGLKAGTYDLRIHVGGQNKDIEVKNVGVTAYDRSGYAHFNYTKGVGAYNDDGTLKSGVKVVYITEKTKNSTGIVKSIQAGNTCVRIIGRISCPQYTSANKLETNITDITSIARKNLGDDSYWNMIDISGKSNITVEGVGEDAEFYQFGMNFKSCEAIEVRNLAFTNYPEDACACEGGQSSSSKFPTHYWVHNCVFNKGKNGWDLTSEKDKGEGDGATDVKKCAYVTFSYNVYNSCHKTGLVGGGDTHYQSDITMHHNYYNGTYSRTPLGRQANIHMYNNYFKSCGSYCVSLRANAFLFSEANYVDSKTFRESKSGGACKSFNDVFTSKCTTKGSITIVTDRTKTVSNSCTYGSSFDTDASKFYYDSSKKVSKVTYITDANTAKTDCEKYAGPCKANCVK